MLDPYKVLGLTSSATDEEIKKAYRALSRKYHPDANINNPNKAQAEERFKEVQQAYEQITKEREAGYRGGTSGYGGANTYGEYGRGYGSGGYSQGGYNQGYEQGGNYYGDWSDIFGSFFGGGAYAGGGGSRRNEQYDAETAQKLNSAATYINNRSYQEAINVLNSMNDRPARWYYYSAIANSGLGNNVNALSHAKQALAMDPDNTEYDRLVSQLEGGSSWYNRTGYDSYGRGVFNISKYCITCCAINAIANLCCGSYGMSLCC